MLTSTSVRAIFGFVVAAACLASNALADEKPTADGRPVEKELKAISEGSQKKAPDASAVFDKAIADLAATGIAEKAPKAGDKMPAFELPDASGKVVKFADLVAKGPVVLTWYRGGWCPYCNAGLRGMLKAEPQMRELGATLVAITPETPDSAAETVKANKLNFTVLSDKGNRVARDLKIVYKIPEKASALMKAFKVDLEKRNGDNSDELPLSVTYVIDRDRTIRWAFVNADYRKRAEPADVVEALKTLKK